MKPLRSYFYDATATLRMALRRERPDRDVSLFAGISPATGEQPQDAPSPDADARAGDKTRQSQNPAPRNPAP